MEMGQKLEPPSGEAGLWRACFMSCWAPGAALRLKSFHEPTFTRKETCPLKSEATAHTFRSTMDHLLCFKGAI